MPLSYRRGTQKYRLDKLARNMPVPRSSGHKNSRYQKAHFRIEK